MAKTPGFIEFVDDRDPTITDVIRDDSKRAASEWFEDRRIDANGVVRTYLFSKENHDGFVQLAQKHDKEFNEWMAGGADKK